MARGHSFCFFSFSVRVLLVEVVRTLFVSLLTGTQLTGTLCRLRARLNYEASVMYTHTHYESNQ